MGSLVLHQDLLDPIRPWVMDQPLADAAGQALGLILPAAPDSLIWPADCLPWIAQMTP